jgi:hypothetical protein
MPPCSGWFVVGKNTTAKREFLFGYGAAPVTGVIFMRESGPAGCEPCRGAGRDSSLSLALAA